MLSKKNFLISTLLSSVILTNSLIAQGLECSGGVCRINVKKFNPSKNMKKEIKHFKRLKQKHRFLNTNNNGEEELKIKYQDKHLVPIINLGSKTYVKQENEILQPETEEEINTIILAANKYVGTEEEIELYLQQQRELGIDLEEIELTLPMSLFYCKNNTEPIYDDKLELFQCIIPSNHS